MPRGSVCRQIAAPVSEIWPVLSDVMEWPSWMPTATAVERIAGTGMEPGAKDRVVQPRLRPQIWTVTRFEAGERFTWESNGPGVSLWADHVVKSIGLHSAEVVLEFRFSGVVGVMLSVLFGSITRGYITTEADSLKRAVESRGRT